MFDVCSSSLLSRSYHAPPASSDQSVGTNTVVPGQIVDDRAFTSSRENGESTTVIILPRAAFSVESGSSEADDRTSLQQHYYLLRCVRHWNVILPVARAYKYKYAGNTKNGELLFRRVGRARDGRCPSEL